jgi:hypothetical protein
MRNVSDKIYSGNQNTHFMFNNSPHPSLLKIALFEIMWKNVVQPDRPQMTV